MKFTTERGAILGALLAARDIALSTGTIPILTMVRLGLNGNSLSITATDTDLEYSNTVTVAGVTDGVILANAQRIADIVKSLPDGCQIEIAGDDNSDGIVLRSGKSRFRISTLDAKDFPKLSQINGGAEFTLSEAEYRQAFTSTLPFVCADGTRYYLCGVHLQVRGDMKFRSTNGHALSTVAIQNPTGSTDLASEGVIIPTASIQKLLKIASGEVLVKCDTSRISFTWGSSNLTSKLIDGTFPDCDRLVPVNPPIKLTSAAMAVKSAVARIALVGGDQGDKSKSSTIRMDIRKDSIVITGASGADEGQEEIEAVSNYEITIGFEPRYLNLATSLCDCDEINILMTDAGSPAVFAPADENGVSFLVMPKRI